MKTFNEFKAFILRGNVVDLAVGIIIGAAFGAVITALVADVITPLIAAIIGKPDFSYVVWHVGKGAIQAGLFLNALVSFLIIAAVVFFFIVKPINMLIARSKSEPPPDPTTRDCPYCLSTIPIKASKCSFCTSAVEPVPQAVVVS